MTKVEAVYQEDKKQSALNVQIQGKLEHAFSEAVSIVGALYLELSAEAEGLGDAFMEAVAGNLDDWRAKAKEAPHEYVK